MSDYNPPRQRNIYKPDSKTPFKISRSKIELFMNCPKCFWLDLKKGVKQVPGYPFTLNSAVDALLKKEFDVYRKKQKPHPLMKKNKVDAVPFKHKDLEKWRDALHHGVQVLHKPTNLLITGGIDDVWVKPKGELIVVDYKATSKKEVIEGLDKDWQDSYKRQSEVYQWLFRNNGFKVSDLSYFVYANGDTAKDVFNNILEFDTRLIPYKGNDGWVEPALKKIKKVLDSDKLPKSGADCDFCKYRGAVEEIS